LGEEFVALAIYPQGEVAVVLSGGAAPESGSGVGPPPGLPDEFYLRGPSFPQQGYALHRSHLAKIHAGWVEYAMPWVARKENWNLSSIGARL
jgi:hypothetical protein